VDALFGALVEMGQLSVEDVAQAAAVDAPAPARRRPTLEIAVPTTPTNKLN
jgi:hypothetical protein